MPDLRKRVEALEGERGDFLKLWKLCVPECDPLVNGLPSQFSNHIRGLQDRAKKAEAERDRLHALLALPDDSAACPKCGGKTEPAYCDKCDATLTPEQDAALKQVYDKMLAEDHKKMHAATLRWVFEVGAEWAWLWWDGQEASLDTEALSRYPNPPAAVLPEQTHARDPQVYPVSGVTRRVVGHVVPGPAPKREKRWRCATCGRRVTRIENVLGILCHIVGKNARCGPVVEEVSDA